MILFDDYPETKLIDLHDCFNAFFNSFGTSSGVSEGGKGFGCRQHSAGRSNPPPREVKSTDSDRCSRTGKPSGPCSADNLVPINRVRRVNSRPTPTIPQDWKVYTGGKK